MKQKVVGVTLLELMIVVAVIGILSSIAVPAYTDYLRRGRIPEATSALGAKRVQMEQFFLDNRTYVGAPAAATDTTTSEFFNFGSSGVSATGYTLTATGKNAMTGFVYSVNQANEKSSTVTGVGGWSSNASCWVTRQGGGC